MRGRQRFSANWATMPVDWVVMKLAFMKLIECFTAAWSLTVKLLKVFVEELLNVFEFEESWCQHSGHLISFFQGPWSETITGIFKCNIISRNTMIWYAMNTKKQPKKFLRLQSVVYHLNPNSVTCLLEQSTTSSQVLH